MSSPDCSACVCATGIFLGAASIQVTAAPSLAIGSDNRPQPQPISSRSNPSNGFWFLVDLLNSISI